jgi:hypothetical protein
MKTKARRMKIGLVAAIAVLAVAVEATAAQAAIEWSVGGKILKENERVTITCRKEKEKNLTLTSTVLGTAIEIKFGGASCSSWEIFNKEHQAYSTGSLHLESPTVVKPANCSVKTFVTGSLTGHALEETLLKPPKVGVFYAPVSGTTWGNIEFTGASCALNEDIAPVKGNNVAEVEGEPKEAQPYDFSKEISEFTKSEFKLGTQAAVLTGTIEFIF